MRFTSCMNALRQLAQKENHNILDNALDFYQKNKYLTPKLSFVIFWRLKSHGIDHSPSFFKVSLKRDKYKNDLREMEPHRVHLIWPALTSSQRKQKWTPIIGQCNKCFPDSGHLRCQPWRAKRRLFSALMSEKGYQIPK